MESAVLGQLFGGAMQQTNMGVSTLNDFAVQLKHQTQHTVCGWVLRTKVQGVVLNFCHDAYRPIP
jgi:hypothetical protein